MEKIGMINVCTANFDRSTMAESAEKYRAAEMKKDQYFEISSAGSKATKIRRLASPMRIRHNVIGLAYENGAFDPEDEALVQQVLADGPDAEPNEENRILYARGLQIIRGQGGLYRGVALGEMGLPLPSGLFRPLVATPGIDVVLGMKEGNAKDARKVFARSGNAPTIMTFAEYAGTNQPVPDPMGKGLDVYRETRDYFLEHAPRVLERALDECR